MSALTLFSETPETIGAECPACGKVLRLRKAALRETEEQWESSVPMACPCGKTYSRVDKKAAPGSAPPGRAASGSWGTLSYSFVCPNCQTKGFVYTKPVDRKKGISGGKVMGALFTGGLSLFATGLSRKERMTQAHCNRCGSTWDF